VTGKSIGVTSGASSPSESNHPLLGGLYQLAYVVRDMDETVRRLRQLGVRDIDVRMNLARPGASGTIRHSAKAWVGPVMLEIIEPVRDRPSLYDAPLPEGRDGFLHHLGCMVADEEGWRALSATLGRQKVEVAVMRTLPQTLSYAYTDLRDEIGLFVEHVQLIDRAFYDEVPRNPPADAPTPRPALDGFFQLGFVARDLDAAMRLFSARFGLVFQGGPAQGDMANPVRRAALAWAGEVMVALMEPDPDVASVYSQGLPERGVAALHHLGLQVRDADELARAQQSAASCGLPTVLRRENAGFQELMVDARADFGHFLKYVAVDGEGQALFDAIPRR
jgi:hypothetical protein